jgi:PKD repeat protein
VYVCGYSFSQANPPTRVLFDGIDATDVQPFWYCCYVWGWQCETPPHAPGTVDVTVINPDSTSGILAEAFTYGVPPVAEFRGEAVSGKSRANGEGTIPTAAQGNSEGPKAGEGEGEGEGGLEWTYYGSAYWDTNYVVLTPDDYYVTGAAWYNQQVDLTHDCSFSFQVFLGTRDDDGSDGITFVLARDRGLGGGGGCLGYCGMANSLAVEIDTYPNGDQGDPDSDHVAIIVSGSVQHVPELPLVQIPNIEDGTEHALKVTWNAGTKTLAVYLDNDVTPLLTFVHDIVADYLGGQSTIWFGMTGSAAELPNLHYVVPGYSTFTPGVREDYPNLLAYYSFDSSTNDDSGHPTANLQNFGGALSGGGMAGSNCYYFPSGAFAKNTQTNISQLPLSMSVWVLANADGTKGGLPGSKAVHNWGLSGSPVSPHYRGLTREVDTGNGVIKAWGTGASDPQLVAGSWPLHQWVHVVIVWEAHQTVLYVNGRMAGRMVNENGATPASTTFWVGDDGDSGDWWGDFDGWIDDLSFHKKALNVAEAAYLYQHALNTDENGNGTYDFLETTFQQGTVEGNAPLQVQFTDLSIPNSFPVASWQWIFGNGETDTVQNPLYTYQYPGNYTVSLTASTPAGPSSISKSNYVLVYGPPTLDSLTPTLGSTGGWTYVQISGHGFWTAGTTQVTFDGQDMQVTGINSENIYGWTPPHAPGTVNVVVTNPDGSASTLTGAFTYGDLALASFTSDTVLGPAPLTVHFTDTSAAGSGTPRWSWDFDSDGIEDSTDQNPEYTYTIPGDYLVSMRVDTEYGSSYAAQAGIHVSGLPTVTNILNAYCGTGGAYGLWFVGPGFQMNGAWRVTFDGVDATGIWVDQGWIYWDYWWWWWWGGYLYCNAPPHAAGIVDVVITNPDDESITLPQSFIYGDAPTAAFSADPTSGPSPLSVNFTDDSTPGSCPITWRQWDFGDGTVVTDAGWEYYPANGHYYRMTDVYGTWPEARLAAENMGGYLTTVDDFNENNWLQNAIIMTHSYQSMWIGLTDEAEEEVWLWTNGETAGYRNWMPGQPDNYGGPEPYAAMVDRGNWDDYNGQLYGIVERETPPPAFTNPTHVYQEPGFYTVSLTVGNFLGQTYETKQDVIVASGNPSVTYTYPQTGLVDGGYGIDIYGSNFWTTGTTHVTFGGAEATDVIVQAHYLITCTVPQHAAGPVDVTVINPDDLSGTLPAGWPYGFTYVLQGPTADFQGDPTSGTVPLTVHFTDLSTPGGAPITAWQWDFGDGESSTDRNPTHVYAALGIYSVSFQVWTSAGTHWAYKSEYIVVTGIPGSLPAASFTAAPTRGGSPLTVQFTDRSNPGTEPITLWQWDFNADGNMDSTDQNPQFAYPNAGTYNVRLRVASAVGSATITRNGYIVVGGPTAYFIADPVSGAAPLTVHFTDHSTPGESPITSWEWDFDGNGTVDSTDQGPTHQYMQAGGYTVRLKVTTAVGFHTYTSFIDVYEPGPPIAEFRASRTYGAPPLGVQFWDQSNANHSAITSWKWDFTNDGTIDSTLQNPVYTYQATGNFTVALTVTNANGSDTMTKADYIVVVAPITNLTVSDATAPSEAWGGQQIDVRWRVTNSGSTPITPSWEDALYLSNDPEPGNDTLLERQPGVPPTFDVGEVYDASVKVTLPQVATGDYYIIVKADDTNVIQESNETDNIEVIGPIPITRVDYDATVSASADRYLAGQTVPLSGMARRIDNQQPVPDVPVRVYVWTRGMMRELDAQTDGTGAFHTTFEPLPNEAGSYTVAANHPAIVQTTPEDSFAIMGMRTDPAEVSYQVVPQKMFTAEVKLQNLGDVPLTGIASHVAGAPANLSVEVLAPATLPGAAALNVTLRLLASDASLPGGPITISFTSAEGATASIEATVNILDESPNLVANPAYLRAGMIPGKQSFVKFDVSNAGGALATSVYVDAPDAPFLSVVFPSRMPLIEPGDTKPITLSLLPAADLPLGPYTGDIVINYSQTESLTVPFQFNCVSEAKGDLRVLVEDELTYFAQGSPRVAGARIRLLDAFDNTVVLAEGITGGDGAVTLSNIPEGPGLLEASADNHDSCQVPVDIAAGITTEVTVVLSRNLVTVNWQVRYDEIEDRYVIDVDTVFETNVPAPVVTCVPELTNVALDPGESVQVNLILTNHGLVVAKDLTTFLPETPGFELVTPAVTLGDLAPQESLRLPVLIRREAGGRGSPSAKVWETTCEDETISIVHTYKSPCGKLPSYRTGNFFAIRTRTIRPCTVWENFMNLWYQVRGSVQGFHGLDQGTGGGNDVNGVRGHWWEPHRESFTSVVGCRG